MNPSGNALVFSSLLGGSAFNRASGIAAGPGGIVYVDGYTSSADFPIVSATQSTFGGLYDAFVSVFTANGSSLSYSTYFGGSGSDSANALAVDSSGNMYLGGQTNSVNLTTLDPIQATNAGNAIGWLARLGITTVVAPQLPQVVGVTPASGSGNSATFTAQFSDAAGVSVLSSATVLVNTTASSNYGCQVTYSAAANQFVLANDVASSGSSVVNPGGGNAQNDQCTLSGSGSFVTKSGNTLTMAIALSFQPGFTGNDTIYLSAADTSGDNTGQVASGTWTATVPAPQPTASSVSPNSGLGASQTFTFVFSDTQNANNITGMAMLFNASVTFTSLVISSSTPTKAMSLCFTIAARAPAASRSAPPRLFPTASAPSARPRSPSPGSPKSSPSPSLSKAPSAEPRTFTCLAPKAAFTPPAGCRWALTPLLPEESRSRTGSRPPPAPAPVTASASPSPTPAAPASSPGSPD